MSEARIASKQFVADFELVAEHYDLKALGEYDQVKQIARNDMVNAVPCFASMAAQIRGLA